MNAINYLSIPKSNILQKLLSWYKKTFHSYINVALNKNKKVTPQ